jgi:predicted permease
VIRGPVLGFALLVACAAGIVFGIAPAVRATSVGASAAMKEDSRSVIGGRNRTSKVLLVVQVAVSLVLLVGAGLFLRTVQNLRHVDIGFDPTNLALFRISPALNKYDAPKTYALYADMLDRIAAVPGVRAVALSQPALLAGSVNSTSIYVQGRTYPRGVRSTGDERSINRLVVSPGFFDTMGISLAAGRALTPRDDTAAPKVALINEAAARKYFPNENPVGQRFGSSIEDSGRLEIVGIVRDTKYNDLREPAPPTMYVTYWQSGVGGATNFEVRTAGAPAGSIGAIRQIVRGLDPNLPVTNVSTQLEQIEGRFQQERLFAQACAWFGGLALVLACIGLFGLMSYSVARRTNELGIRLALGAQREDVLSLVMGESLRLVAIGLVAGLAVALATGRLLGTILFDVSAVDPWTIVAVCALMVVVSAAASYLPARRASRIDPLAALHAE